VDGAVRGDFGAYRTASPARHFGRDGRVRVDHGAIDPGRIDTSFLRDLTLVGHAVATRK
jgi:hypothetical protein